MWAKRLLEKKPFKLVAVALANKMARIAFAILRGKTVYRETSDLAGTGSVSGYGSPRAKAVQESRG